MRSGASAYSLVPAPRRRGLIVAEGPPAPSTPRLLDRVRTAIRARHYSPATERAYASSARRYIVFHGKQHPATMGASEVTAFLSHLAIHAGVSASTQNQALSALLFLYREVLRQDVDWLDGLVRAKRPARLPVVLTRAEVRSLLANMGRSGSWRRCCTAVVCA